MGDGQKKKAEEKWIPQLERDLRDFRSGAADASVIFKKLEGESAEIPVDISENKESFLLRYILTAVQDCHLKNADQDIVLAAFGFLQGYENQGVQERHYEYCKWVGIRTKDGVELPLDIYWPKKNLHKQMNAKENSAIKRLYNALASKMGRNGGILGYTADSKIEEICNKAFPQPYYLQEKGYRKCSLDGRIFYIPLTPAELRTLVSSTGQSPPQDKLAIPADATPADKPNPSKSRWGDSIGGRRCYTLEEVNAGALDGIITFNSLSNGVIGDERYFVGVRENTGAHGKQNVWICDKITVENKKEYVIRLYVHNNSKFGIDATSRNVKVAFNIPQDSAKHIVVVGFINADNAYPARYWSSIAFDSDVPFHLEYVPGSALLENNGIGKNGGIKLPDDIVIRDNSESGTLIGYSSLDGRVPSSFSCASYVTVKVKVVYDTAFTMESKVRLVGSKDWSTSVDAKAGDRVEFQIQYRNTSSKTQRNVMVRDVLPKSLRYVAGTTKLWNADYNGVVNNDDTIATTGINIGHYESNSNAYIRFQADVVEDGLVCGMNTLMNWAQVGVGDVTLQEATAVYVNKGEYSNTPAYALA